MNVYILIQYQPQVKHQTKSKNALYGHHYQGKHCARLSTSTELVNINTNRHKINY